MKLKCVRCNKINSVVVQEKDDKLNYLCISCGCKKKPIEIDENIINEDIISQNVKLAKQKQRFQDINRTERNSFRKDARLENAFEEYSKKIYEILTNFKFPEKEVHPKSENGNAVIVHLTDTHFNELVDLKSNKYDFKVASKRLFKFAVRIINYLKANQITEIYLVMTGDLINSDRRLDELLSMAANRAKATLLAVQLLNQFITHLAQYANINVISVSGNESRIREEYTNISKLTTDNFDFMIHEILKLTFRNDSRVNFISGEYQEYVLGINGKMFLLCHGNLVGKKMAANDIAKTIARHADNDIKINYIVCGHLHETKIKDVLLRSGSLVGANDYSEKGLNLVSKASQNIHIIYNNGDVDSIKVDLQHVDESDNLMYDIDKELEAYNAKSLDKIKDKKIIFQTVI